MAFTPPHELQLQCVDPVCDETMYLDSTWKIATGEESNPSLSDCVPPSFETLPNAEPDYSCSPITGANSVLESQDEFQWQNNEEFQWQSKHPQTWSHHDVREWIKWVATAMQLTNLRLDAFVDVNGPMLCKMQMEQFQNRDPSYGDTLCHAFSQLSYNPYPDYQNTYEQPEAVPAYEAPEKSLISIDKYIHMHNISFDKDDTFPSLPPFETSFFPPKPTDTANTPKTVLKHEPKETYDKPPSSPTDSEASCTGSQPKTGRRGRSKGKLWEFVLNLLLDDETNPSIIKWEDRTTGVFRIVRSDQVAKKWGIRKSNPSMTYEKMSRAMRYYYRKNILERIDGRRLVYKFGSGAKGWQL